MKKIILSLIFISSLFANSASVLFPFSEARVGEIDHVIISLVNANDYVIGPVTDKKLEDIKNATKHFVCSKRNSYNYIEEGNYVLVIYNYADKAIVVKIDSCK